MHGSARATTKDDSSEGREVMQKFISSVRPGRIGPSRHRPFLSLSLQPTQTARSWPSACTCIERLASIEATHALTMTDGAVAATASNFLTDSGGFSLGPQLS
jgi:hypothetical protein